MRAFNLLVFLGMIVVLTSCSTSLSDYRETQPAFKLEQFFTGKLTAWGTFEDINGKVIRRFRVEMVGSWQGNDGILDEDFYYADGKTEKRIWKLKK